ncbi:hypothetical protein SEVIR_5G083975v4 [Setaria viridis]
MVFSDDDDLIAQWWARKRMTEDSDDSDDDNDDYDFYIAVAAILGMEHERTKTKCCGSVSGHQAVMREMPSGKLHIVTNKRPRTDNSTSSAEKVGQDEEDDSNKNQTPDSSQPSQKKRPVRRKQARRRWVEAKLEHTRKHYKSCLQSKRKKGSSRRRDGR